MNREKMQAINQKIADKCPYMLDGVLKPMHTSLPVPLPQKEWQKMQKMPAIVAGWVKRSVEIYLWSLTNPELFWVRDMIERGSSPETVEWSRAFTASERVVNPCFARPDMSQCGKIVELQIPGSTYGVISIFEPGLIEGTKNIYRSVSGTDADRWLYVYFNRNMVKDTEHLTQQVGMRLCIREIPDNWRNYSLIRRQFLHQLIEVPHGKDVLAAALTGDIIIDPLPCLLFDQKLMSVFPFHSKLRSLYGDDVRNIMPQTALLEKDKHGNPLPVYLGEKCLSIHEILTMSNSQRDFVLKYAGTDPWLRFGGHGVYRLKGLSHERCKKLFAEALRSNDPWILQEGCWEKHLAVFLNGTGELHNVEDYYTLWRPVFSLYPEPKMVSLVVYQSQSWKVHGTSESLITVPAITD